MLTFHLKKVWYDKIKAGEKTHEYRFAEDYWNIRVINELCEKYNNREEILACFVLGYNPKTAFYGIITKVKRLPNGLKTDLKTKKPVFDFSFRILKKQYKQMKQWLESESDGEND